VTKLRNPAAIAPVGIAANDVVRSLRGQIATLDEAVLRLINLRVSKVAALRAYKKHHGIPDFDPAREAWLRQHLQSKNDGPLTNEAVRELLEFLLDLSRSLSDQGEQASGTNGTHDAK
jgi:chorismate mutase